MTAFDVRNIEISENNVAYATLENGDVLTIASNGLARHNGQIFRNYGDILSLVPVATIFDVMAREIALNTLPSTLD